MLTYINVYIFKLGMPPSHILIFSFVRLEWVNYWKSKRWAYRRLKTNKTFDETCWVHICICKKRKKIGKVMMRKVATSRKKQESLSTIKNKTHFSLWVFDCDLHDALVDSIWIRADDAYIVSEIIRCKSSVSDSFLIKDFFP